MDTNVRRWQELTVWNVACLAAGLLAAGCASEPAPMVVGQPLKLPALNDYCAVAQKEVATSRVPARNVLMTDYQAFSRASPQVKPLETMQFVGYSDAQKTRPRMISCKLHSAERIRAEYGATAAGEATTCARLNRRTLDAVLATLTDRRLVRIVGRRETPGRPLLYGTTREFLEVFSLPDLSALPTLRELGDGADALAAAAAASAEPAGEPPPTPEIPEGGEGEGD